MSNAPVFVQMALPITQMPLLISPVLALVIYGWLHPLTAPVVQSRRLISKWGTWSAKHQISTDKIIPAAYHWDLASHSILYSFAHTFSYRWPRT